MLVLKWRMLIMTRKLISINNFGIYQIALLEITKPTLALLALYFKNVFCRCAASWKTNTFLHMQTKKGDGQLCYRVGWLASLFSSS